MVRVASGGVGASFVESLAALEAGDDAGIADLIDGDGRRRAALGEACAIEDYLGVVEGLEGMPLSLDAAIEAELRSSLSTTSRAEAAVARMAVRHPGLADRIGETAALSRGMWSTRWLIDRLGVAPEPDLPCGVGRVLDGGGRRYELVELIGRGSCGSVYRAVDRALSVEGHEALVAVKMVCSARADEGVRRRALLEATNARRVDHGTVVGVLDRGEAESGALFIVYEHVEGRTLASWLGERGGRVGAREAARMVSAVARGVQAAHDVGVIHCDLHPTNVLVDESGRVRVCDFGIALLMDELGAGDPSGWGEGGLGSLAFMPPEQHEAAARSMGPAADVYALGGLLHYLVTGELPNGDSVRSIRELLGSGLGAATRLTGMRGGFDRDLSMVRDRALATLPGERHSSAAALADDLDRWLERRPIEWTRPGAVRRARMLVRRRPVMAGLAAVALAGVLVAGWAVSYSHGVVVTRRAKFVTWLDDMRQSADEIRTQSEGTADLLSLWLMDQRVLEGWLDGVSLREVAMSTESEVLRSIVERAYETGASSDPGVLMLEMTWLVRELSLKRETGEMMALLERNRSSWAEMLPPDHQYFVQLDVLESVAEMKEEWFRSAAGGSYDEARVARAEARLLSLLPRFEGWYWKSQEHAFALRTLRNIHGEHLRRDAMAYEQYRRVYNDLVGMSESPGVGPTPGWDGYERWVEVYGDGASSAGGEEAVRAGVR